VLVVAYVQHVVPSAPCATDASTFAPLFLVNRPLVIAHRGNSSAAPENTLASFQSALDAGATLVECDVQMTHDGRIVVIHDPTLDRTSNMSGDVRLMTLEEVKDADASYPANFGTRFAPQRVLTLVELIAFLKGRARLMVEIKRESSGAGRRCGPPRS
jgi:glycerophosphoryl diester phosphodiesterase